MFNRITEFSLAELSEFTIFGAPDLDEIRSLGWELRKFSTALSLGRKVDRFWSPFLAPYFLKKMLIFSDLTKLAT